MIMTNLTLICQVRLLTQCTCTLRDDLITNTIYEIELKLSFLAKKEWLTSNGLINVIK